MSEDTKAAGREDPVEGTYMTAERVESNADLLGWLSVAAFLAYVVLHARLNEFESVAKLGFVGLASLSILLSFYFRFALQPEADKARRLLLLSDSFGIPLTPEHQQDYYTSSRERSTKRLLHSLCEDTFFYPRLLAHDLPKPVMLVLLMVIGLSISLRQGSPELVELFAVLLLFSDLGLARLIRMVWMIRELRRLHEECYHSLVLPRPVPLEVEALRLMTEYESIKSRGGVRGSDRTFKKLNPTLTTQWAALNARIPMLGDGANDDAAAPALGAAARLATAAGAPAGAAPASVPRTVPVSAATANEPDGACGGTGPPA